MVVAASYGLFFEHAWYFGQKMFVFGIPWLRLDRLVEFGWNNRVSSAVMLSGL